MKTSKDMKYGPRVRITKRQGVYDSKFVCVAYEKNCDSLSGSFP